MELRHIRYFVRAAECLHFTRAAESLRVSQPALSIHIQQLEKELGSPLFDRTGRQVRLTEAGKRLLTHANEALRALERGRQELADLKGLLCGTVTFGVNNFFVPRLMAACIPAFSAAYPNVDLIVKLGNLEDLERGLLNGEMDLAFAWLPTESTEIEVVPLVRDELVLVVASGHPLAERAEVAIQDLHGLQVALPTLATNTRRLANAEFAKANVTVRVSLEVDDTPARLTYVETGRAATLAPRSAIDGRAGLYAIPIRGLVLLRSAGLLIPRGVKLGSATQLLKKMIGEHFKPDGTLGVVPT